MYNQFTADSCRRMAAGGRDFSLALSVSLRVAQQTHCTTAALRTRSGCPSCRARRGRVRRQGQNGGGVVLLVENCWLRSSRYPSPPAVADKAEGTGDEQGEGGGFGGYGNATRIIQPRDQGGNHRSTRRGVLANRAGTPACDIQVRSRYGNAHRIPLAANGHCRL